MSFKTQADGVNIPAGRFIYKDQWRPLEKHFDITATKPIADGVASGETFVLKLQCPMDVSGDSRAGQGMPTPAVLLIHNADLTVLRMVSEFETGHIGLLRAVASSRSKCYVYGKFANGLAGGLSIYTEVLPDQRQEF